MVERDVWKKKILTKEFVLMALIGFIWYELHYQAPITDHSLSIKPISPFSIIFEQNTVLGNRGTVFT